jgi:hypothetical protein
MRTCAPWSRDDAIIALQEVPLHWTGALTLFFKEREYFVSVTNYGNSFDGFMGVALAFPEAKYRLAELSVVAPPRKMARAAANLQREEKEAAKSLVMRTRALLRTLVDMLPFRPLYEPVVRALAAKAGLLKDSKPAREGIVGRWNRAILARLAPTDGTAEFAVGTYVLVAASHGTEEFGHAHEWGRFGATGTTCRACSGTRTPWRCTWRWWQSAWTTLRAKCPVSSWATSTSSPKTRATACSRPATSPVMWRRASSTVSFPGGDSSCRRRSPAPTVSRAASLAPAESPRTFRSHPCFFSMHSRGLIYPTCIVYVGQVHQPHVQPRPGVHGSPGLHFRLPALARGRRHGHAAPQRRHGACILLALTRLELVWPCSSVKLTRSWSQMLCRLPQPICPNYDEPSDHIAIAATLTLEEKE